MSSSSYNMDKEESRSRSIRRGEGSGYVHVEDLHSFPSRFHLKNRRKDMEETSKKTNVDAMYS